MTQLKSRGALLLLLACLGGSALARPVTIEMVTERDGKVAPLAEVQALWKSPFDGWVVSTWPFAVQVDKEAVMVFKAAWQKLMEGADQLEAGDAEITAAIDKDLLGKEETVDLSPNARFQLDRPSSVTLDLGPGEHRVSPGNLVFTVEADGTLASQDARVQIQPNGHTLRIRCYPVVLRAFAGERSISFPLRASWRQIDLLGGLSSALEEFERQIDEQKNKKARTPTTREGFRQVLLYLPPSAGQDYKLCDLPFGLDANGRVSAARDPRLVQVTANELRYLRPTPDAVRWRRLGVRWQEAPGVTAVSAGDASVAVWGSAGAAFLEVPEPRSGKGTAVALSAAAEHTVWLPHTFAAWPYKTVVFNPTQKKHLLIETAAFTITPGGGFDCRITALVGELRLGRELACWLERLADPGVKRPLMLRDTGDSTFNGALPTDLPLGLWQVIATDGPLENVPLALLLASREELPATVSLYTYRNRGLFRRGDPVDLYWTVRAPAGGEFDLVLLGPGVDRRIASDKVGAGAATGHLRLDSAGLAPGDYVVAAKGDGLVNYPARFRVCQRERRTDYELYSHAPFAEVSASAAVPLTAYYGGRVGGREPGLAPLRGRTHGGLDPAFGVYSTAAGGPAIEKCAAPGPEEELLMIMAGLGARAVPGMPPMIHHEEWNPKHSLPEELQRLRRRVSLFTQKYADLPGFGGIRLNWYATLTGYWEESERLDGHQQQRNAAAHKWIGETVARRVAEATEAGLSPVRVKATQRQAGVEARSSILPNAYEQYLASANVIRPGLTSHTGIPSFWIGGGGSYTPVSYHSLTHRDAVDYTDYGRAPWGNFRAASFLGMGNPDGQPTQCAYATAGRHARFIVSFGAAGRGMDGFALAPGEEYAVNDYAALLRIFERYGSYFRALEPLPDVAVYYSAASAWAHQKSVILHDLARLRRPGVLLSRRDVLAGKLSGFNVLLLTSIGDGEPQEVLDAFAEFARQGGKILKDRWTPATYPGQDIGFVYDKKHVHRGWGLGGPNGEWEFAHLWTNYLAHREAPLLEAFKGARPIPVSTEDREVLISPLAGQESILCFAINLTYVPMSVAGKWRQHAALPRRADLLVADGWHAYDLLTGQPAKLERRDGKNRVSMDFTRAEGRLYLLLKREPQSLALRTERTSPLSARVTAWLADDAKQPIGDPLPFEVTMTAGDATLFHRFAALGPGRSLDLPIPAMKADDALLLTVRDLVTGRVATQEIQPAAPASVVAKVGIDTVGEEQLHPFLHRRQGRVVVLLDEGQEKYRVAADRLVAVLQQAGREAQVMLYDPAAIRTVPLRWRTLPEDKAILDRVVAGKAVAWRRNLSSYETEYEAPNHGYHEYGPRTWIDGDVVLFGAPRDNRALADLDEFLRRRPSANYPTAGRFFLHYLWDPFLGGRDGIYIGCRDAAGAEQAVAHLANLRVQPEQPAKPVAGGPRVTQGGEPAPLEDLLAGQVGTEILDVAFSPSGTRLFVTADSYGDSFFIFDAAGELLDSRPIHNRCGNNIWWRGGGRMRPIDEGNLYLRLGSAECLMSLEKGFLSRGRTPPHGLPGRNKVPKDGPTLHRDLEHGRSYLGGRRKLHAIDANGLPLWTYDDAFARGSTNDMLYQRSIFIRGVTPDGALLLASAFGIEQDVYSIGRIRNQSVFCVDTQSGKVLWRKNGLQLSVGKTLVTNDRFVVVDDDGKFHILDARTGASKGAFRAVQGTDWIMALPRRDELLIVENNHFDRHGPTNRSYLRAPGDNPDILLPIGGRILDARLAAGGSRIVLSSERGETACFATDGKALWRTPTPTGGAVAPSPDGRTVVVGSREGTVSLINMADGKVVRTIDINPYNVTTPEQFVEQSKSIGTVPEETAVKAPPPAPLASYLTSLDGEVVKFGANLLPAKSLLAVMPAAKPPQGDPTQPASLALLAEPAEFALAVKPRQTYLVEFLAAAGPTADKLDPQTRLEITVKGRKQSPNLPFTTRLPIGSILARRRLAFRTDENERVTLSLRVVGPTTTGEGRRARKTYGPAEPRTLPVLLGETVVAAMSFASPNLLFEGGPGGDAPSAKGAVKCEVWPWTGGANVKHWYQYNAPKTSLRVVNGVIANEESHWNDQRDAPRGSRIKYANAWVKFEKPQTIAAVAVYEDASGPVPSGKGALEKVAVHYGIYAHEVKTNKWRRVGFATSNTNLVNVFTFPPVDVDQLRYFWAGREDVGRTDGYVRMAEIEAYTTEEAGLLLDDLEDEVNDLLRDDIDL